MNYCRRCESDYEKPGTCNCFAEGGDARPAEVKPAPTPWVPGTLPYVPVPYILYVSPWWVEPYWYRWSSDYVSVPTATGVEWTTDSSTHVVNIDIVPSSSSYTVQ